MPETLAYRSDRKSCVGGVLARASLLFAVMTILSFAGCILLRPDAMGSAFSHVRPRFRYVMAFEMLVAATFAGPLVGFLCGIASRCMTRGFVIWRRLGIGLCLIELVTVLAFAWWNP